MVKIEFDLSNDTFNFLGLPNLCKADKIHFDNFGNLCFYIEKLDFWVALSIYDIKEKDFFILQEYILYNRQILKNNRIQGELNEK